MKFSTLILCFALSVSALAQDGAPPNALPLTSAGAPSTGTSEIQTLTIGGTPTAGTFKITYDGFTTAAITWSATNDTLLSRINTALDALKNLEDGEVVAAAGTLTSGIGTITLTFGGNRAKLAVNLMVAVSSLTGTSPTAVITETTPGVTATGRGAPRGRVLIDTTNGILYIQTASTPLAPTWTKVGVQDSLAASATELAAFAAAVPTVAVADIGAVTQTSLTDSSGGAATTTLAAVADAEAAVTDTTAASLASVNTTIGVLKNAIASLAAEIALIKTDNTADRAKINDALAKLRTAGVVTP